MEAVDFATRFEETTGIEILSLADDLPGAAALLASYRLVEQGELGLSEAVDLLRRSLQRFTLTWVQGVSEITSNAFESQSHATGTVESNRSDQPQSTSANSQVSTALWTLASESWNEVRELVEGISQGLSELDWASLVPAFGQQRAASNAGSGPDDFQR